MQELRKLFAQVYLMSIPINGVPKGLGIEPQSSGAPAPAPSTAGEIFYTFPLWSKAS